MDEPSLFTELSPGAPTASLDELREAAAGCTNCDLYRHATQTVFGAGPQDARLMLVGEQPGDREDVEGEPFVGPAGRLLDQALVEAGIDRDVVYVTNAVKHFKFAPRGKRRIHATPKAEEIRACRPWLDGEIAAVRPAVVAALGATAAKVLLGPSFRVSKQRGEVVERDGLRLTATIHPSAILRGPPEQREAALNDLVDDLRGIAALLGPP
ncbi:MAG: UdgX family uracil-DNA binding protein [Actinomycetota bacterium]|nr:UdgX family uracil-DNA binding protein [Actinomycetota bacterium]